MIGCIKSFCFAPFWMVVVLFSVVPPSATAQDLPLVWLLVQP